MEESAKVAHVALPQLLSAHSFLFSFEILLRLRFGGFLLRLIKAEGKYQKAISVLFARINEMSQMN